MKRLRTTPQFNEIEKNKENKDELFHILIKWTGNPESPDFRSYIYEQIPLTRDTANIVFDYIVMEVEDKNPIVRHVNINDSLQFTIDTKSEQWKNIPEITLPTYGVIRHVLDGYDSCNWELNIYVVGLMWNIEIGQPSSNANLILRYFENGMALESVYGVLVLPPNKNDITWHRKS